MTSGGKNLLLDLNHSKIKRLMKNTIASLPAAVLVWAISSLSISADPTNRYVSTNGSSSIPYDTWATAGTSLIGVVSYANTFNEGDTVWVSNGVYVLTNTVTVANTVVQGAGAGRSNVVVNGAGLYRCFTLTHSNALVAGLTISNGYIINVGGGGAYVGSGTLSNCAIVNNMSTGNYMCGGGVRVDTGTVVNCLMSGNTIAKPTVGGSGGGGIYLAYSGVISNCIIINNVSRETAENGGGGVAVYGNGIIDGCIITGNVSDVIGGGLFLYGNSVARNCLISGNSTFGFYGSVDYFGGGGVAFNRGGVVSNCLITGNYSGKHGGGVYIYRGSGLQHGILKHCRVFANTALTNGGGVYTQHDVLSGENEIINCVITGNTAGASGGGVGLYGSYGLIRGCLIADNTAVVSGGGWYSRWYAGNMQNCTIVRNSAPSGGGMTFSYAYFTNINSIVYHNAGGASSNWSGNDAATLFTNCCTAPLRGGGNITVDPMLGNIPADCHLLRTSPCINAGLYQDWMPDSVDADSRPRIREKFVDIGAYESFPKGSMFIGK